MIGLLGGFKILWHEFRCPVARATDASTVTSSDAGRIYECPCGFGVWEVFAS